MKNGLVHLYQFVTHKCFPMMNIKTGNEITYDYKNIVNGLLIFCYLYGMCVGVYYSKCLLM